MTGPVTCWNCIAMRSTSSGREARGSSRSAVSTPWMKSKMVVSGLRQRFFAWATAQSI